MNNELKVWRTVHSAIQFLILVVFLIVSGAFIFIQMTSEYVMHGFGFNGRIIGPFYSVIFRIISLCTIIFFGQLIPGLICDIFRVKPLTAANSQGLYVRFRMKRNIIPWSEVKDIKIKRRNTQILMFRDRTCELHISVKNLNRFVRRWFPIGNTLVVVLKGVDLDPQQLQRDLLEFKTGADASKGKS